MTPQEELEYGLKYCMDTLLRDGDLMPLCVGTDTNGGKHLLGLMFKDADEKHRALCYVRQYFLVHDIQHYVLHMEAWVKSSDEKEMKKIVADMERGKSLEFVEGRDEVIVAAYVSDTETIFDARKILRDENKKIIGFEKYHGPEDGQMLDGAMMSLLPPKNLRDGLALRPAVREKLLRELEKGVDGVMGEKMDVPVVH